MTNFSESISYKPLFERLCSSFYQVNRTLEGKYSILPDFTAYELLLHKGDFECYFTFISKSIFASFRPIRDYELATECLKVVLENGLKLSEEIDEVKKQFTREMKEQLCEDKYVIGYNLNIYFYDRHEFDDSEDNDDLKTF